MVQREPALTAGSADLAILGLERGVAPASSSHRFPDGGAWRVEIPSVEGVDAARAVLDEARELSVPVHRISQGSGVMMLTDAEIAQTLDMTGRCGVEVCL